MDNMTILIDALIDYLNRPAAFPWTELISIIAALLSLVGVIYVARYSVKNTSRQQNASARVEWIQNVRNTTAKLISTCFSGLNEHDSKELLKIITIARENVELLILYFGPDAKKEVDILDETTNEGKNDQIVDYLNSLSMDLITYYKKLKVGDLEKAEHKFEKISNEMQNNIIGIEHQEDIELDGERYTNTEYTFEPSVEKKYNEAWQVVQEMKVFDSVFDEKLMKLRNVIRIYLKIEWKKAKKGK